MIMLIRIEQVRDDPPLPELECPQLRRRASAIVDEPTTRGSTAHIRQRSTHVTLRPPVVDHDYVVVPQEQPMNAEDAIAMNATGDPRMAKDAADACRVWAT